MRAALNLKMFSQSNTAPGPRGFAFQSLYHTMRHISFSRNHWPVPQTGAARKCYSALRGRDAKTGLENPEKREEQFALMREGQKAALNLANWHHFLGSLILAGYRGEKMVSSETAIIYSYVLYLIGVCDYRIAKEAMRRLSPSSFSWWHLPAGTRILPKPVLSLFGNSARLIHWRIL